MNFKDVLRLRKFVALLDEKPAGFVFCSGARPAARANQRVSAIQLEAMQPDIKLAFPHRVGRASIRRIEHRVDAAIPDDNRTRAIVALGYKSFEVTVLQ